MKRRMALNSLAQAGQKLLSSQTQMDLMRQDLSKLDLDGTRLRHCASLLLSLVLSLALCSDPSHTSLLPLSLSLGIHVYAC